MIITKLLWKESRKKTAYGIETSQDRMMMLILWKETFFFVISSFFQHSFVSWCYAFIIGYSLSNFLNHTSSFFTFFSFLFSFLSISSTPLYSSPRSYIELKKEKRVNWIKEWIEEKNIRMFQWWIKQYSTSWIQGRDVS